jgi:hypothetical protein
MHNSLNPIKISSEYDFVRFLLAMLWISNNPEKKGEKMSR